jgi:glycosyltransferase involved in cell wall biosynthesis
LKPKLHIALPVLNEYDNLPVLMECLKSLTEQNFTLWVCVNHFEHWRGMPEKAPLIEDNNKSLEFFKNNKDLDVRVVDRSSEGKGWSRKKGGVGMARKTAMDAIVKEAKDHDIIVSMDADTLYPPGYLEEIRKVFENVPDAYGLAVPYYHPLTGNEENDRLILRYEIYMRNYALNMMRIENPYAFSALGSAMAFPVWAYKKVGGLTPVISGEDFYFLQKLVKNGKVLVHVDTVAKPSARLSDRVVFGTGPALIKGEKGDWSSYPLYHYSLFDKVKQTFDLFPQLYEKDVPTPMDVFLKEQFREEHIWQPLRSNYKDRKNFVKACINKVDGLRILQFLRKEQQKISLSNEEVLTGFLENNFRSAMDDSFRKHLRDFDFYGSALCFVDMVRDFMFEREEEMRKVILNTFRQ